MSMIKALIEAAKAARKTERESEAQKEAQQQAELAILQRFDWLQNRVGESEKALKMIAEKVQDFAGTDWVDGLAGAMCTGDDPTLSLTRFASNLATCDALRAHKRELLAAVKARTVDVAQKEVAGFMEVNGSILKKYGAI